MDTAIYAAVAMWAVWSVQLMAGWVWLAGRELRRGRPVLPGRATLPRLDA